MSSARSLLVAAALALAACTRPEPPTVKPISGKLTAIGPNGLDVEARLEAYNPNDFDIQIQSFTATIVLDHQVDLGQVTGPRAVTLPAKKKKVFDVPMAVKWNDVAQLVPFGLSSRDVPWDADGTAKIHTDALDLDLPFKVSGVVTHQQIMQAAGRALPRIPGLPF